MIRAWVVGIAVVGAAAGCKTRPLHERAGAAAPSGDLAVVRDLAINEEDLAVPGAVDLGDAGDRPPSDLRISVDLATRDLAAEDLALRDLAEPDLPTTDLALVWTRHTELPATNYAAWGSSSADVYVVGNYGGTQGRILHSTGDDDWIDQAAPTGTEGLFDIWGSSATDVYAVGAPGVIAHSTGDGTWVAQASGTTEPFASVWGSSKHDVYALGIRGTIVHSTGDGIWTTQRDPNPGGYQGIFEMWGSGKHDIYAPVPLGLMHSTGDGTWPSAESGLSTWFGIWGTSKTSVYSYGTGGIWHWDGGAWTHQPQPSSPMLTDDSVRAMGGFGPTDVYASNWYSGRVIHSTGNGVWTVVGTFEQPMPGIWASGPRDVYLIGAQTIFHGH